MKKSIKRVLRFLVLICITNPLNSFAESSLPPVVSFNIGKTNGSKPGTLDYYWKDGVLIGFTVNSPYGLRIRKVFINPNVNFGYSYLPAKKNVLFPIESFGNYGQELITANSTGLITVICNLSFTVFPERSRFAPYFYFGLGYLKRSNLVFESNSPLYESVNKKYDPRLALSFGLGCSIRLKNNISLLFDMGYIGTNDDRLSTTTWPVKIGLGIN